MWPMAAERIFPFKRMYSALFIAFAASIPALAVCAAPALSPIFN